MFRVASILCSLAILASCGLGGIHAGSVVKMNYTLQVDGKIVDSREEAGGYEFKAGTGQIPRGLDAGLRGLKPGASKTVTVPPELGYGLPDSAKIRTLPLSTFGALAKDLKIGNEVNGLMGGRSAAGRVTALDDKTVTLDFNHPLAGKTLVFKVKILQVADQ